MIRILSHGVAVEVCFSLGRDVVSWRQSTTPAETVHQTVIKKHFARANTVTLAGDDPALEETKTENDLGKDKRGVGKTIAQNSQGP